jgi:hypothetical protein
MGNGSVGYIIAYSGNPPYISTYYYNSLPFATQLFSADAKLSAPADPKICFELGYTVAT